MKKVRISVEEKLVYRREIDIRVPDEWEDSDLESALDKAQREEMLSDFMYSLSNNGVDISNGWDDSLDSPDTSEVECDDYEFIDEETDDA